ncbi:Nn.00g034300.m01.CDS01 [Neocucurbitaria sp. VM-36]
MEYHDTPPCSDSDTPDAATLNVNVTEVSLATPTSISSRSLELTSEAYRIRIPANLTQAAVDVDYQLKRIQQDLLILTSINENETIHWRPSWFNQEPFSNKFWTLQNPPNVITERIPHKYRGRQYYTRRMRQADDPPPLYIKTWHHWRRYCDMYGLPQEFLSEGQIELMRLGLLRNEQGNICAAPPSHPLYPEPQPPGRGRYILDPSTYITHLPKKFHSVNHNASIPSEVEVVVVHSDGALKVEPRENFFMHSSQWTHFDGYGGYRLDEPQVVDDTAPKEQGPGRRWAYLPWTKEQEESCKPLKLDLRPLAKRQEAEATRMTLRSRKK